MLEAPQLNEPRCTTLIIVRITPLTKNYLVLDVSRPEVEKAFFQSPCSSLNAYPCLKPVSKSQV